jgi:hypothetical protein
MNEYDLNLELKALARGYRQQAGEHVERKVLAEYRRRRRQGIRVPLVIAACLAATAGTAIWQILPTRPLRHVPVQPAPNTIATAATTMPRMEMPLRAPAVITSVHPKRRVREIQAADISLVGFISLPSAIAGVPLGSPYIVRTKLSAAQLNFAGLPVIASDLGQQVDADVFVESDGMIRAIRLQR